MYWMTSMQNAHYQIQILFRGLGFRDFYDFNIVFFTKQLWRLIHYPNFLLTRVLKEMYYNHTSSLENWRTYSLSFGWRSIITAKLTLISDLRKMISTDRDTRVWSVSCIPDSVVRPPRPADHIVYRLS